MKKYWENLGYLFNPSQYVTKAIEYHQAGIASIFAQANGEGWVLVFGIAYGVR